MKKLRKKKEWKLLFLMGSLFVCAGMPGQMASARSSGSKTVCEKFLVELDYAANRDTGVEPGSETEAETRADEAAGTEMETAVGAATESEAETDLSAAAEREMETDLESTASTSAGEKTDPDAVESETETAPGAANLEPGTETGLDAAGPESETEIGLAEAELGTEIGLAEAELGTETGLDAVGTEAGTVTETGIETEQESDKSLYADGAVFTIPSALSDAIGYLTGVEMETEAETEPESETEAETETEMEPETEEETQTAIRMFLEEIRLGSDFQIPMAMPEEMGTLEGPVTYSCGRLSIGRAVRVHAWQQEHTMEELEKLVQETIEGYDGTWSVYVKNLNTNESFVINDQPMKSASVMKLFIMGAVYTAIEEGELERTDEIMSLMNAMISYSDNASSNQLLYILGDSSYANGIEKVNAFIQSHGYSEMTVEYNGFSNSATNSGNGINQVAAKDVGQLLEDIYRRTWMSRAVSNEMEEMLLAQHTRTKIPAGLPDDVLCANKTGEMSGTENDAAIIYSDACDYILVVLSNDVSDSGRAIARIASLSELVYEFFN